MKIESADNDAWNIAEGIHSEMPTMIRYRPNLRDFLGDENYPRRLTITWAYKPTNSSGLPSDDQSNEIRIFEDAIVRALDPERIGVLAFVFTSSGTREWHFYVPRDMELVGAKINDALIDKPNLPITLEVEDDPDWSEMRKVLGQCRETKEP